jgi:adenylate cyclase
MTSASVRLSTLVGRKVPQVVGVYLAGSWALLEFVSWAVDHGHGSAAAVDAVLVLLLAFLPAVIILAWRAGGRGPAVPFEPLPHLHVPGLTVAPEEVPGSPVASAPSGATAAPGAIASPAATSPPAVAGSARAGPLPNTVAILPLDDLSPGSTDAYLGAAISDEIITALARVETLWVASRTSSFAVGGAGEDLREIGRRLGVGAVLEGSVQRAGDRLRVSTRLASTADGFELWSNRWDATMTDLFRIEDEIASGVVVALRGLLGEGVERVRAVPRTDIRAYEPYLKGRQFLHQSRRKALGYARQLFQQAIDVDPGYALAHAALADSIAVERMFYPAAEVDLGRAEAASLRALELAPDLAEVHSTRGLVLSMDRRFEDAEAAFGRALAIDPRLFDAHYYLARTLFQLGRTEDAARSFEAAGEVRDDHEAAFFAGQARGAMGQTDAALEHYRKAAIFSEHHMQLNPDDARAATIRAVACCRTGRTREGLEWAARAVEMEPHDGGVLYNVACLYSVAGEREQAIGYLERAAATGFGNREWVEKDPDLASIRDDPRVQAVLAAM